MLISNIINTEQTARTNIILSSLLRTTRTMYFHTKYNGTQVHKLILNEPCTMENICNSIFKSGTLMCVCTLTWCACRFCFRIINYYANQPFIQIESIRNRILIPVRQVLLFLAPSSSCFLHLFSMFKSPPSASDWINQSINQQTNHQTTKQPLSEKPHYFKVVPLFWAPFFIFSLISSSYVQNLHCPRVIQQTTNPH